MRNSRMPDTRVHACLYFIAPSGRTILTYGSGKGYWYRYTCCDIRRDFNLLFVLLSYRSFFLILRTRRYFCFMTMMWKMTLSTEPRPVPRYTIPVVEEKEEKQMKNFKLIPVHVIFLRYFFYFKDAFACLWILRYRNLLCSWQVTGWSL